MLVDSAAWLRESPSSMSSVRVAMDVLAPSTSLDPEVTSSRELPLPLALVPPEVVLAVDLAVISVIATRVVLLSTKYSLFFKHFVFKE
jgi:hypothetical protein